MEVIKIAIIEDDSSDRDQLVSYLEQYIQAHNLSFVINTYQSGEDFLQTNMHYQLVFMDIELPGINGIETAEKMRHRGGDEVLILVTNMVRYAVHGYAVKAVDYMVKPVLYEQLALKLPEYISMIKRKNSITVKNRQGMVRVNIQQIRFIEVYNHNIVIHLANRTEECYGSLKDYEVQLRDRGFVRCSQSCLVNLAYVDSILGDTVLVDGTTVPVSRREKKNLLYAFTTFDGGYGV